ncbi:MAG: FMN-binding negative transcriptional regulator [Ilumatobacteraceae bacterium]|nr:FMN-binding negative transcriptional regulator [Ilumatobacteraceae bacterium]
MTSIGKNRPEVGGVVVVVEPVVVVVVVVDVVVDVVVAATAGEDVVGPDDVLPPGAIVVAVPAAAAQLPNEIGMVVVAAETRTAGTTACAGPPSAVSDSLPTSATAGPTSSNAPMPVPNTSATTAHLTCPRFMRWTRYRRHRACSMRAGPWATPRRRLTLRSIALVYLPAHFAVDDVDVLHAAIDAAGPAHLVTVNRAADGARTIESSVVPLLLDRASNRLVGHLARANHQWRDLDDGVEAVAIFSGPNAYISPSFFASKRETGRVVPTWNYEVIHATGRLVVHDDVDWVVDLVTRLTERHEAGREQPWSVTDTPDGYIETAARAIVGIELEITRLEGKHKLSQNRTVADIDGTIAGLSGGTPDERAVAAAMQRVRPSPDSVG